MRRTIQTPLLLGWVGVTDLAQDIRVRFYDGVTPSFVALDGGVHQPQAKAHIQHIPTPTTNSLQMQQTFAISASKGSTTCVIVQLKGLSRKEFQQLRALKAPTST